MRYAPMRFCGLALSHNPHTLAITDSGNLREMVSPCCEPDSEGLGLKLRAVSGEGEFFGEDCMEQYRRLETLLREQRCGKLMLPQRQPMYAYLRELSLTAEPLDQVVKYRFRFVQAQSPRVDTSGDAYYTTQAEGESLWDIGYRFDVAIGKLVELNPQIPMIDDLKEKERVRLW